MNGDTKMRFCSTGSHWTAEEFRKVGTVRWLCMPCYLKRKAELRNLTHNKLLAAGYPKK